MDSWAIGSEWMNHIYCMVFFICDHQIYTGCTKHLSMTKTDQGNPGESYDPLLMSPVKSTSISVDEREETGYIFFKPRDNWDMDCVAVPFSWWLGKTKYLSAFEWGMAVGARRTGLCQELQRCWDFHAQQFPVCIKNGPPPKGHPANLTQLWEALESSAGPTSLWNAFDTL